MGHTSGVNKIIKEQYEAIAYNLMNIEINLSNLLQGELLVKKHDIDKLNIMYNKVKRFRGKIEKEYPNLTRG